MRRGILFIAAVVAVLSVVSVGSVLAAEGGGRRGDDESHDRDKTATILEFETMVGVPPGLTGSTNPIRGISGGGLPWVIRDAEGELDTGGHLEIKVKGLVLDPNDPTVIGLGRAGVNPASSFKAIVSCLGSDGVTHNVATDAFAANPAGDSKIEQTIVLPQPCIAPIVFVTSAGGAWFAATGF